MLESFHESIKFTHEKEADSRISFLDVSVIKKLDGSFDTDIYRKKTDTNVYLNWKSFAPRSWKIGTLKGFFRRAFVVCSTKQFLKKEIAFLKHVFTKCNGYPSRLVNNTLYHIRKKIEEEKGIEERAVGSVGRDDVLPEVAVPIGNTGTGGVPLETAPSNEVVVFPHIILPYKGDEGDRVINKFKNTIKRVLPSRVKPRYIYKGKKLGSFFKVKDRVKKEHQTDLVYAYQPESNGVLSTDYVGETKVRYESRVYQHQFTDKRSAVFKYTKDNNIGISPEDFTILETGYKDNMNRKIAESLYIKQLNPKLNEQKLSNHLMLFN